MFFLYFVAREFSPRCRSSCWRMEKKKSYRRPREKYAYKNGKSCSSFKNIRSRDFFFAFVPYFVQLIRIADRYLHCITFPFGVYVRCVWVNIHARLSYIFTLIMYDVNYIRTNHLNNKWTIFHRSLLKISLENVTKMKAQREVSIIYLRAT